MSLCYEFQKWTMISFVSVAIILTVGLLMQYVHGINPGDTIRIKVDFGTGPEDVLIPNGCLGYSDQFLDNHAEVIVNKECSQTWRQYAKYFIDADYKVTLENVKTIKMEGAPLQLVVK